MGEDTGLVERVVRLETLMSQVPDNGRLMDTAATQGKLAAQMYMDGLTKSFQEDTHTRLQALEKAAGRMYLVNAALLAVGIILGQKLPTFIP